MYPEGVKRGSKLTPYTDQESAAGMGKSGLMLDALQQIRYIPTNEIILVLNLG